MMKSVKWFLAVVVMFSLVLGGATSTALASEYVTLQEIREEVKDGWHQSYEVNGRTVIADIPIDVPNAHSFPVIRAGLYESLTPPQTDATIMHFTNGIALTRYDYQNWELNRGGHTGRFVMPNHQAEDNPLTPEQAEELARSYFSHYQDTTGALEIELRALVAYSRYYVDKAGVDRIEKDFDLTKPRSPMGSYLLYFRQLLHGIPLINGGAHYIRRGPDTVGNPDEIRPYGFWDADIYSADSYSYSFSPIQEKEVLVDDVPLIPFSKALEEFEKYIATGQVYWIYSVGLGYMAFDNPEGDDFILRPVWTMGCYAELDTKRNFPEEDPEGALSRYIYRSFFGLTVDAQTGDVYIPTITQAERPSNLNPGKNFTWDDVE